MTEKYYDSDRAVSEYLLFHYGRYDHPLPMMFGDGLNFPVSCVTECIQAARLRKGARALDLGCAVGRSAFELARFCAEVTAIDYSEAFIKVATQLRDTGVFDFKYIVEGDLLRPHRAIVPRGIARERVHFERGDATQLRLGLGEFDVVLMANLIDRLPDPAKCLAQLPALLRPGGQLVITSPYTWLMEYTPRGSWLGGFERDGKPVQTLDTLRELLKPDFDFRRRMDLPFVIREHARKFQFGVAEASIWVRK